MSEVWRPRTNNEGDWQTTRAAGPFYMLRDGYNAGINKKKINIYLPTHVIWDKVTKGSPHGLLFLCWDFPFVHPHTKQSHQLRRVMARMVGARNDPKAIKVVILSANSPELTLQSYELFSEIPNFLNVFLCVFSKVLYFCKCFLPMVAVMSSEEDGAAGWGTTYWKALLTLCFWSFKTSTIEQQTKTLQGWLPRGVYIRLRSVLRDLCSLNAHFTVYLYTSTWVFLCLFFAEAVEGPERRTGRCKHPRFSFVVITSCWTRSLWVFANNSWMWWQSTHKSLISRR